MKINGALICIWAALLAAGSFGRDSNSVNVYRAAADDSPAAHSTVPTHAGTAAPQLTYTLPSGWKETAPGNMRVASFLVASPNGRPADVGVIPMPAAVQEIQLINMWRQELQLPAAAGVSADHMATNIVVGNGEGRLYDLVSDSLMVDHQARVRMLVAMHQHGSINWFFKMVGEDAFVEGQKSAFLQFLKSVSIGEAAASSGMGSTELPPSHPVIPGMNTNSAAFPGGHATPVAKPTWTIPADWHAGQLSQFLAAKFVIPGENNAKAEVNVSALAGTGGGLLPNINRWRAQLGLNPVGQDDLNKTISTFEAGGTHASVVDFTGTDLRTGQTARLVAVVLPRNRQTWFYKLMGDESVVARQKAAFTAFIKSAKYPDAN